MYSFEQVLDELDYDIKLKTFKNWANRVEKLTDRRFERRYAKNIHGHSYSYKVFSSKDVLDFQELVRLRKNDVPLREAIIEVFVSEENKSWVLDKQEFQSMKDDIKNLVNFSREIVAENAELKRKLLLLEKRLGS